MAEMCISVYYVCSFCFCCITQLTIFRDCFYRVRVVTRMLVGVNQLFLIRIWSAGANASFSTNGRYFKDKDTKLLNRNSTKKSITLFCVCVCL